MGKVKKDATFNPKMKVQYSLVYCADGIFQGDGRAEVQLEAALRGRREYFSTGVYVLPEQWDEHRCLIVDYPNADALNAYLFEVLVNLERFELDLWKRGVTPTLELLREGFDGGNKPQLEFRTFCEKAIVESTRRVSTQKNLLRTVDLLLDFRREIEWQDITHSFVQQFRVWLVRNGFGPTTVVKHLRNLRTLVNEAIVAGHMSHEDNPFISFKISMKRSVSHKFLSPRELAMLEGVNVSGRLAHVKDAFLFCCYTGLRFSDFCLMKDDMLQYEGECLWLRFQQQKTGGDVSIPISYLFGGKAEEIVRRYGGVGPLSKVGSNSKTNLALKVLQKKAGVRTYLTFHVARHTCATLLCHQGVPITTVQKILGHNNVSTTQIYQEVMAETVLLDLKRAEASAGFR